MDNTPNKGKEMFNTLPKMKSVSSRMNLFSIGVPKETGLDEKRVALTPSNIDVIMSLGFEVFVEYGAGEGANITDLEYSEAGAKMLKDKEIIFTNCDIICKIAPLSEKEVDMLGTNKIVFSALNLSTQSQKCIKKLQKKKITAIAYELFSNESGFNPFVHVIGEIIGTSSVMIASELLSSTSGGRGIILGGLSGMPPSKIIVLGTDISAEYAVRIALGMGGDVKVFDNSISNLIHFHNIFGQHLYTSTINSNNIRDVLPDADVIINTLEKKSGKNYIITDFLVSLMKKGSVIVDLKVDSGSIIETSKITSFEKPTFEHHEVIHYCVPNLASRVAYTSSVAISNLLSPPLIEILQQGSIIPFLQYETKFRHGTYLFKGVLTNKMLAETLELDYTDINFIIHVF
ncbi:MAG: alanine dehydrogenase [Bacteroidota bacterium]|nr:alanine dehydrogenase [Bacteroidota bacterium]